MAAAGDLRYVWLTSSSGSQRPTSPGSGSSASRDTLKAVIDWVEANGTVVDAAEYGSSTEGTLYYLGG
jgi:hypothetical protein